jgi:hypothetical protein
LEIIMVWLEIREAQALQEVKSTWSFIREAPDVSNTYRPTFGFRVIKHFTSRHPNGQFLPGMQGVVRNCTGGQAYVEARDLFDAAGNLLKEWIPRSCIEIGTKKYNTWSIDICQVPRISSKLIWKEITLINDPKYKHLALGISTYLQTLAKTKPLSLTDKNLERLGGVDGSKVPWITARVIEGVQQAGLVSVLNNPHFTFDEVFARATINCKDNLAQGVCGIYLRRYIQPNGRDVKKLCSIYVGQSSDFKGRSQWWDAPGPHDEMRDNSDSVIMYAICVVPKIFYDDHKYLIEQLFVSLLETYKEEIVDRGRNVALDDFKDQSHTKNCYDMVNIAAQAAQISGWTGAVLRKSCWQGSYASCDGLNWQSPLAESPAWEASVWIRKDGFMPDMENGGKSVPIANFTRAVPKLMKVINPSIGQASQDRAFVIFHLQSEKKDYQMRISRTLPASTVVDGVDWPAENTFYDLTFEVRTDWKPHPFSWARLPLIGPFMDWDRANSWALSISWKDPSGQNRSKYLHCERPHWKMSETSDGSIQPYAKGIEVSVSRVFLI